MNERERIIEIIEQAQRDTNDTIGSMNGGSAAWYADKLIEAGVTLVVHSEWDYGDEPLEVDENGDVQAFCKRCGSGDVHAKRNINKVPYCWKCGAKMDGGNYETD